MLAFLAPVGRGSDERTGQDPSARKPYNTSRIARLAGLAVTVVGLTFATSAGASITSSENPSTDGSYTVSWSAVPNAHSHQLYENDNLVYDGSGTSRSFTGKTAGSYEYTLEYCEIVFDYEEICAGSGYTALTVTVTAAAPDAPTLTAPSSSDSGSYTVSWTAAAGATSYVLQEKVGSGAWSDAQNSSSRSKGYTGKADGMYRYRVKACAGSSNCSVWSAARTVSAVDKEPKERGASVYCLGGNAHIQPWTESTSKNACQVEYRTEYSDSCLMGGSRDAGCNLSGTHTHPFFDAEDVGVTCGKRPLTMERIGRINRGGLNFTSQDISTSRRFFIDAHLGVSDRSCVRAWRYDDHWRKTETIEGTCTPPNEPLSVDFSDLNEPVMRGKR